MRARTPTRLILAFALLLPAVASQATAPGQSDLRDRLLDKVQSVCANNPSQVCTTRLPPDDSGEFDPAQCPATPAPQQCIIDYVPNSEIRALMTVSGDDSVLDTTSSFGVRISVLIEFQIGEDHFVIDQQFPAGSDVFGWNPISSESEVFHVNDRIDAAYPGSPGSDGISKRLVEIAGAKLGVPANSVPVLVAASRKTPELEVDQSVDTQITGSVARYRISIRFAKPAP